MHHMCSYIDAAKREIATECPHFIFILYCAGRIYIELIRCPERPELEKEYVLHLSADRIIFYSAKSKDMKGTLEFQWPISVIKRAKYHNFVGKVEIEVGR